jgi:hypothetical protein
MRQMIRTLSKTEVKLFDFDTETDCSWSRHVYVLRVVQDKMALNIEHVWKVLKN